MSGRGSLALGLLLAGAVAVGATSACSDGTSDDGDGGGTLYPQDFRAAGYVQVRECRNLGEHSGIGAFTVWVNPEAAAAFDEIFASPGSAEMPAGTIVVKESYGGSECDPADVANWVAMAKEPGFDQDHGDWHWQSVSEAGAILSDGAVATCIDCHAGVDSCTGYGAMNGYDYLCTEP